MSFGWREFDLIKGLRYQTRQVDSNSTHVRLRRKYLNDNEDMKEYELDVLYPSIEFENDEEVVKMSPLYFIEFAFMRREQKSSMHYKFLGYVDDWEALCNIVWGKHVFEMTMKHMKKGLQDKVDKYKESINKKLGTYSMYGFPHAFLLVVINSFRYCNHHCISSRLIN